MERSSSNRFRRHPCRPHMKPWWALTKRQTLVALTAAVLVGIMFALLLPHSGEPPSAAAAPAVWVFGFATARADLALRHAAIVRPVAFGGTAGAAGGIYLYDPGTGRLGFLDAARNTIRELPHAPRGSSVPDVAAPVVAVQANRVWLVPSPNRLAVYDTTSARVERSIRLPARNGVVRRTAVIAAGRRVIAVSESDGGVSLTQVDRSRGVVTRLRVITAAEMDPHLLGVAGTATALWIVTRGRAVVIDPKTLAVRSTQSLVADDAVAGGATATGTSCFVLRSDTAVVKLAPSVDERVVVTLRHSEAASPTPAAVVAAAGRVYALVPEGSGPQDHRSQLTGARLDDGTRVRTVQFPSSFFAGGLAVSSASP